MSIIKLTLAYDGSNYHGWQRQTKLSTVQAALESALSRLTQKKIIVYGAGRTYAKVHALAQVAHFSSDNTRIKIDDWQRALNALLPDDIVVGAAVQVDDDFHARFSAKNKQYRYCIHNGRQRSAFTHRTAWFIRQTLDLSQMSEAATALTGTHCFTSFCATGSEVKNHRVDLKRIGMTKKDDQLTLTFEASRFLQYMVRNLVGFLVEVGRGQRFANEVPGILAAKDRRAAGLTAPAHGLFLVKVDY